MGNHSTAVIYVGIHVPEAEFVKAQNIQPDKYGDVSVYDWVTSKGIDTHCKEKTFSYIYTEDDHVNIGYIIAAIPDDECVWLDTYDLIDEFEKHHAEVSEELRILGVTVGKINLYTATEMS
jgi:hypothetical protein